MSETYKDGELVAVMLRENNVVRCLFGRCLGRVVSPQKQQKGALYLVHVFGIEGRQVRTIDIENPWYPTLTRAEGERLEPNTEPYARATFRHIAKPRFVLERDSRKGLYHLQIWSFAMATNTQWVPFSSTITTTIDDFVIHASGNEAPLPFLPRWSVFVAEQIKSEIQEGTDPFNRA